jgi:hypothetical protein
LTTTLARISTLPGPIPVEQVPAAVARTFQKRRPQIPGEWPLPVEAVRAWVQASPLWRFAATDEIEPIGPRPVPHPHDQLIRAVLSGPGPTSEDEATGRELNWTDLHRALKAAGLPSPTAGAVIRRSPLLRRTPDGYVLLGPPVGS